MLEALPLVPSPSSAIYGGVVTAALTLLPHFWLLKKQYVPLSFLFQASNQTTLHGVSKLEMKWSSTEVLIYGKTLGECSQQTDLGVCVFSVEEECDLLSSSSNFNTPGTTSSVAQVCLTLCDPMDCSMPRFGFPVHHQLLELAQTHVHQVGEAIQPSHPLSSPSPPALNLSQHQGLFQ